MYAEAAVKKAVKPLIFRTGVSPRRIRFGPGRGVHLWLDRQRELQKELGLYESELIQIFKRNLSGTEHVLDVGAADGFTSITIAAVAKGAMVTAFEPNLQEVHRFERNLALNRPLLERIRILPLTLGSSSGGADTGVRSVDDLIAQGVIPEPDFVKIDVDGGEAEVISGMIGAVRRRHPVIVVETHSEALEERCRELLVEAGMNVSVLEHSWWRLLWPEYRPIEHNRWLVAERPGRSGG